MTGDGASKKAGDELPVVERVVHEHDGSGPTFVLTRTNYVDWALVMRVQLQAQGLWTVVDTGAGSERDDRRALGVILRNFPPEMLRTLAVKDSAKLAWDTVKTMRMGVERVREAKAQTRRAEFEALKFHDGESVEAFAMRLTGIVNDLELLDDPVSEHKVVLKFLRVVPRRYRQMAMAIESLCDTKNMSIEELCGRLVAVEERYDLDDEPAHSAAAGRLLLTEEC